MCCSAWGLKESDTTERLNNNNKKKKKKKNPYAALSTLELLPSSNILRGTEAPRRAVFSPGKGSFRDSPGLVSSRQSDSDLFMMKFFGKLIRECRDCLVEGCDCLLAPGLEKEREMGGLVTNGILFRA